MPETFTKTEAPSEFFFDKKRLTQISRRPKLPFYYRLWIIVYLLFGVIILASALAGAILIAALLALLVMSGGAAGAIVLAKFGKLAFVALIPLWVIVSTAFRLLTLKQEKVPGRAIAREDAPLLFSQLDAMRRKMRGPKIDAVMLVNDLNAMAITRPLGGYWFIPFRRRYIALGAPLLQSLTAGECLSVVAHEYGHLSGYPSAFDAFVYRFRALLLMMLMQVARWTDWSSRLFAKILHWYIVRFEKITHALCRDSEYAADAVAAALTSCETAAAGLARLAIAGGYFHSDAFWGDVFKTVETDREPTIRPWTQMPAIIRAKHDWNLSADFLRAQLERETGEYDTHPATAERMRAIGVSPEYFRDHKIEISPVAAVTAAETWFGDNLGRLLEPIDREWQDGVREKWRQRHEEVQEEAALMSRLAAAEAAPNGAQNMSVDDKWRLLELRLKKDETADCDAAAAAFSAAYPNHGPSRLAWGAAKLSEQPEAACAALRAAALLDVKCAHQAADMLSNYYARQDGAQAAAMAARYRLMAIHFAPKAKP